MVADHPMTDDDALADELAEAAGEIVRIIQERRKVGCAVVLWELAGRPMGYASTGNRDDVVRTFRELAQRLQGEDDDEFLDLLIAERERHRPGFVDRVDAAVIRYREDR